MFARKHRSPVLVAVGALALGVPAVASAAIGLPGSNGGVTIGGGAGTSGFPLPVGPGGGFPVSSGSFTLSSGSFTVSSGSFSLPSGSFTLPSGSFTLPSGSFTLPSGSFTLPSGSFTPPSGFPAPGSNGAVTIGAGA
jgi:hypothetical protein